MEEKGEGSVCVCVLERQPTCIGLNIHVSLWVRVCLQLADEYVCVCVCGLE